MNTKAKKAVSKQVDTARVAEAIDYKLQAYTYDQIAEQMKITVPKAVELVHQGLGTLIRDPASAQMLVDLQRIDQMLTAVYPAAVQGDYHAVNTVLGLRRERELIEKRFERAESFRRLAPEETEDE